MGSADGGAAYIKGALKPSEKLFGGEIVFSQGAWLPSSAAI